MATTEDLHIAMQITTELERIMKNIRLNAESYLARAGVIPTLQLASEMRADADQFQRRLERIRRVVDGSQAKVNSGLAALSLSKGDLRSDYVLINNAMQQLFDASLETDTAIANASNQILSVIPNHDAVLDNPLPAVR